MSTDSVGSTSSESTEKVYKVRVGWKHLVVVGVLTALIVYGLVGYVFVFLSGRAETIYPILVEAKTVDPNTGVGKTSFARGELVGVRVNLSFPYPYFYDPYWHSYYYSGYYSSTPLGYVLYVEHFNSTQMANRIVVFLNLDDRRDDTIGVGVTRSSTTGFTLPVGASTGTYVVKVFVFNEFAWSPLVRSYGEPIEVQYTVT